MDDSGAVWTQGDNSSGQLGIGTTTYFSDNRWNRIANLITYSDDTAPANFLGRSIQVVISQGTGDFASSGSYRLTAAATGSTYTLTPISGSVTASSGTYTYLKTGPQTATLTVKDSATGPSSSSSLLFLSTVEGTFEISGTSGTQSGRIYFEVPPAVRTQPRSRVVGSGESAIVTDVAAYGAPPLRYQWYKDGVALPGLTSSGIITTGITSSAVYHVEVSNSFGGTRSDGASIRVVPRTSSTANGPGAAQQVKTPAGTAVSLSPPITTSGLETRYQWRRLGIAIPGATNRDLRIESPAAADAGSYELFFADQVTAAMAWVYLTITNPPLISTPPSSQTLLEGSTLRLTVAATSPTALTYQWLKNNAAIAGATASTYTVAGVTAASAGDYAVRVTNPDGTVVSPTAKVVVASLPALTGQPAAVAAVYGSSFSLQVTATGTAPLEYQWLRNGVPLPGATSPQLDINEFQSSQGGRYSAVVSNAWGKVTSNEALVQESQAPAIIKGPASVTAAAPVFTSTQSIFAGASFSVTASGTGPVTYQWYKDGMPILGSTTATLTYSAVSAIYAGNYSVEVSNASGRATTFAAKLNIGAAADLPLIIQQPASATVAAGSPVTLTVRATGKSTLRYVWRRNGQDVQITNSATFATTAPAAGLTDRYNVMVQDASGNTVPSDVATITSAPSSVLSNLSVRTRLDADQTLILGAVAGGGPKLVLARATGPALRGFGLEGMEDPRLDLYTGGSNPTASNDDWPASMAATAASLGAFPLSPGSKDAGLIQTVEGSFTLHARGRGAGIILVETYDAAVNTFQRLSNLSTLSAAGSGGDTLIAGFTITGSGTKRVLIRGIGPALGAFGVSGYLADPTLVVYDRSGKAVASNDDWSTSTATTSTATPSDFFSVGAFPLGTKSRDSAIAVTLNAGASYTVHVSGKGSSTGQALIEIYELPTP